MMIVMPIDILTQSEVLIKINIFNDKIIIDTVIHMTFFFKICFIHHDITTMFKFTNAII